MKNKIKSDSTGTVPVNNVERWECPTKDGNVLSVFYNRNTNLVVVDVLAKNDAGGNEIFRQTLDEPILLSHVINA